MELLKADLDYFKRGELENAIYWRRIGGRPAVGGKRALDVGCGLGSMCVELARAGAARVVGLDTETRLIDFANENVRRNYPDLAERLEFKDTDLKDFPESEFDYIFSKDSFEHIMDLAGMLEQMKRRLKPGGKIYSGFGPLYNSPFGHHGRIPTFLPWRRFPWGHLMERETRSLDRLNRIRASGGKIFAYNDGPVTSIYDLGLNKLSLADYRRIFQESGLKVVSFKVNQTDHLLSRLFFWLHVVPPLAEFFTHNIYCVLERADKAN